MAITSDPAYPIPGEDVSLAITGATGSTDATQFEITSVPDNSDLDTGMLTDEAGDAVQEFTPDVPGAYAVTAYDYRRFSGVSSFAGDPAGEARDLLVATQTGTIYVGDVMDLPIRGAGHEVKLRLTVVDGTVRAAELVEATTDVARYAALDTTVLAAVAALVGVAAASLGQDLPGGVEELREAFEDHAGTTSGAGPGDPVHLAADSVNEVVVKRAESISGAINVLNKLYDGIVGHLDNYGGDYHTTPDRVNLPISAKGTDVASATVVLADLRRRVYSRHIATVGSPAVHGEADGINTVSADSELAAAVVAILDYFASETPATPTGENPGAVTLAAKHGMVAAVAA